MGNGQCVFCTVDGSEISQIILALVYMETELIFLKVFLQVKSQRKY